MSSEFNQSVMLEKRLVTVLWEVLILLEPVACLEWNSMYPMLFM